MREIVREKGTGVKYKDREGKETHAVFIWQLLWSSAWRDFLTVNKRSLATYVKYCMYCNKLWGINFIPPNTFLWVKAKGDIVPLCGNMCLWTCMCMGVQFSSRLKTFYSFQCVFMQPIYQHYHYYRSMIGLHKHYMQGFYLFRRPLYKPQSYKKCLFSIAWPFRVCSQYLRILFINWVLLLGCNLPVSTAKWCPEHLNQNNEHIRCLFIMEIKYHSCSVTDLPW